MHKSKKVSLDILGSNYKFDVYEFDKSNFSIQSIPINKGGVFIAARAVDPSITVGVFGVGQCDNFNVLLNNKRLIEDIIALYPSYLLFYLSEDNEERKSIVDFILKSGAAIKRLSIIF